MRKTRLWIVLGCCLIAAVVVAWAQSARKPGLWEITMNMSWQQTPLPPGVTMPAGIKSPFADTTITKQVCMTQEMIDKFGGAVPPANAGCKLNNVVMNPHSMSADLVCTGRMNGKGTLEASWTEGASGKGKMHFVGAMQAGPNPLPVEYTVAFSSIFKGADCGSMMPMTMPAN
ncbi:MAG: DUF3617 family protein [Terracidiphilus sp.]